MSQTKAQLLDGKSATIQFTGGSASAPSVSFTGDTNTGIYSPGADQVAISTGGSGRLFVDASGRVGVGTSSPAHDLDVLKTASGSTTTARIGATATTGANNATLILNNGGTGNATLRFDYEGSTNRASIGVLASDQKLTFGTAGSTAMTIDASQRVGIGTATPQHLLDCTSIGRFTGNTNSAASGAGIEIGYDSGNTTGFIQSYNRGSSTYLSTAVDGSDVRFKTSSTERARIDSSGRLLVGTSTARGNFFNTTGLTPGIQLEGSSFQNRFLGLISSDNGGPGSCAGIIMARQKSGSVGGNTIVANNDSLGLLTFQGSDGTEFVEGARIEAFVDGTPGANDMPGRLVFSTTADGASSPTERLRITSAGLVGIGTTSPSTALDIAGELTFSAATAGWRTAAVRGIDEGGNFRGALAFYTHPTAGSAGAPTERARIDSSGRLLVGTSSGVAKLEVFTSSDGDGIRLDYGSTPTGSTGPAISFGQYNNNSAVVTTSSIKGILTGGAVGSEAGALVFNTSTGGAAPAERARIDSSGRLLVGTSSSSGISRLVVQGRSDDATGPGYFYVQRGSLPGAANALVAEIDFNDNSGNSGASISAFSDVGGWTSGSNHRSRLVFSTTADGASSPTERMRITSGGELLVGGTNDNGAYNIQCNGTGVWGFGAYVNGSDERLKENINPLPASLDVVKALNPVVFQYKPEFTADTSVQPGFIAQELQTALAGQVYVDGVVRAGGQYLNVAYQALIPVLTKALQEAIGEIELLKTRIADLERA